MITNKVYVNNKGVGRTDALKETERMCDYLKLSRKSRLHIRLLTEELLGMAAQIGGDFDAELWAEHEGNTCRICLEAEISKMSLQKREELLRSSTSGKNAAYSGIMDRVREKMEIYALMMQENAEDSTGVDYGVETLTGFDDTSSQKTPKEWRLSEYKGDVARRKDNERIAAWDEFEKSIVANIADDISVGIKGETVMLVITKSI